MDETRHSWGRTDERSKWSSAEARAGRKEIESLEPWPRRRWGVKSRVGYECYTASMTCWIDL